MVHQAPRRAGLTIAESGNRSTRDISTAFVWLCRLDGAVAVEDDAAPELQARVVDKPTFQRVLKQLAKAGLLRERVVPRPAV